MSWTGRTRHELYSPARWGTLILRERPLLQSSPFLFLVSFAAGLLGFLIVSLTAARFVRSTGLVLTFETAEGERKIFDIVKSFTHQRVPDKTTNMEDLISEFSIDARKIDRLFKKYTGNAFNPYLMSLRIEVAKERLRSSNASEASVAELCGFKNVEEMERMFLKYSNVTPYKYRMEQQIT